MSECNHLNDDCLEHLLTFLSLKEWLNVAQVCQQWKLAALYAFQKFRSFTYNELLLSNSQQSAELLDYSVFLRILQLIAPNLEYATLRNIQRSQNEEIVSCTYSIRFNHIKFYLESVDQEKLEDLLKIFLRKTNRIKTLTVVMIPPLMIDDWDLFFQNNNKMEKLTYYGNPYYDIRFYHDFFSCFPSELKQVRLRSFLKYDDGTEGTIVQLLQRQTQLSEFQLSGSFMDGNLDRVLAELQAQNITVLCLEPYPLFGFFIRRVFLDSSSIRSFVPNCTNLTKLSFKCLSLSDDLCGQIVTNCRLILILQLESCRVSERAVQELVTLPNLNSLHLIYMRQVKLTRRLENLKKLELNLCMNSCLNSFMNSSDMHELVGPDVKPVHSVSQMLEHLPNLSTLVLRVDSDERVTEEEELAAQMLIKQVYSRGMNIILHCRWWTYPEEEENRTGIIKTTCKMPSDELFEIFATDESGLGLSLKLSKIHIILANAVKSVYSESVQLMEV